jgi:penicillin-binding protein activator
MTRIRFMPTPFRLAPLLLLAAVAGCAAPQQTQILDPRADVSGRGMGLDARDFSAAAQAATAKLLSSGALDNPRGGRYVVAISTVTNDTMQRIDTDQLVKKIRVAILNSGKAVVTTAVGGNGPEDAMSYRVRELRESSEFSQRNVARRHEMQAPDLSLSGKFLQNNTVVDNGQRVDYAFQLSLTDLHTGLAIWEDEEPLAKLGSNATVAW